jgi:putative phosphoesterase
MTNATVRIGLIADVHSHAPAAADLPPQVLAAFRGCDRILALGDMGDAAVLDRLESCAPVVGTRGGDDVDDGRLAPGTRCLELGGVAVGVVFALEKTAPGIAIEPELRLPDGDVGALVERIFGRRVAVVAYGATHQGSVSEHGGVLFVNPGSPTLSPRPSIAILVIQDRCARAECIPIG